MCLCIMSAFCKPKTRPHKKTLYSCPIPCQKPVDITFIYTTTGEVGGGEKGEGN